MYVHSITFLVYQPFQLEGVMAVSVGVKTRPSEKIVLPVDVDRTTVVLAQEPATPHITHTHADCTLLCLELALVFLEEERVMQQ